MRAPWAIVFVFLLVAGCLTGGPLTGKRSPAFSFVASDGALVNETTHLGKFVVLDLMATWCAPCKLEVGHLRKVQETVGDKAVIYSVSVEPQDTIESMETFEREYGASWPYAIDRELKLWRAMQGQGIPKLVILDPEGVVVFERFGEVGPAAIVRVIDPSAAPSAFAPILAALGGLTLGFLAAHNPYRRAHRDAPGAGPTLSALAVLAGLALVAWPLAGIASTRATYGSLFIGVFALAGAAWWFRARSKTKTLPAGVPWQRASDRAYELGAGFAGALVFALASVGTLGFFAPLAGFLVGAAIAYGTRERVPARASEALGVLGLVLVGAGLLSFGARILFT